MKSTKVPGKTIRIQKAHEHEDLYLSFIFVAKKNINNSTTCMGREREQASNIKNTTVVNTLVCRD